ncbi:activating signal cointegrator 1 [Andrena cerasifolii]|uniref:activating signal cointegrator 1 n=1 Tax=Andrena cerasifolii TaxID=2819439 RepID=UPI004037B6BC
MEKWIYINLSSLVNFPVTNDLINYIMQMENERDLDEVLKSLLDQSNAKHMQFITDIKKQMVIKDQSGYKKVTNTDNGQRRKKGKGKAKDRQENRQENRQPAETTQMEKVDKKKTKFVNLYSQDGKDRMTVLLKGRHKCNCEAKTHSLINNCQTCGRIVCVQEGAGPCFCCGEIVCSAKDQMIISGNTKQADQLYNKLKKQKPSKTMDESIKQRDKLLEYDRNGTQCMKVIDDECDYYQSSSVWLTGKERERLQKLEEEADARKYASRLDRKVIINFDFTGREVIEDNKEDDFNEFSEEQCQDICESLPVGDFDSSNICPDIEFSRPMYVESNDSVSRTRKMTVPSTMRTIIQDKEYLEMSDAGLCLSMHQPYASFLVAGIKIHEGRTWYTSHRGRLWIASASKVATQEEIAEVQNFYRVLKNEKINFPESYPTSRLLGCVTVTDILSQEEYRKIYPDGESDSPYVFICENFYSLPVQLPVHGKHKIYKLDPKIHQAALKFLQKFVKCINN